PQIPRDRPSITPARRGPPSCSRHFSVPCLSIFLQPSSCIGINCIDINIVCLGGHYVNDFPRQLSPKFRKNSICGSVSSKTLGAPARTHILRGHLRHVWTNSFHRRAGRIRHCRRCAVRIDRGSGSRHSRTCRRTEHFTWLSSSNWRLVAGAVPGSREFCHAQLLGRKRPHDGANADDHVHEERFHARWRAVDLAVWNRAMEPGCAAEVKCHWPATALPLM